MICMKKKTVSLMLIITIICSVFAIIQPAEKADAASFPTGYPNTYKNTGSYANDIVGVAKTQIGYQENSVGTKYGNWYYAPFVSQPWCAMFVSWCANQAKVPNDIIKKFSSCSVQVNWFKSIGRWQPSKAHGGTYTPKKGDIVFYRDGGSSAVSTHVGVLVGLNGQYLNVIEGNATNGKVCQFTTNKSRMQTSSYVIGYGTPNYGDSDVTATEDEPDTYENWEVEADALTLRKSHSTSSDKVGSITMGNVIQVTEFKLAGGYLWGYTDFNGKKGWCALNYCDYLNGNIDGTYYQLPPTVSPNKVTLYIDGTKKLTATNALGATYSSSDKTIAKVTKKGKITALKPGTATIKCTTSTGSATCKVTVNEQGISKKSATTCVGDSFTLKVNGTEKSPTWKTSNAKIAKVTTTGKVTGVAEGKATITASVGSATHTCDVVITQYPTTYERFQTKLKTFYLKNAFEGEKNLKAIPKGTVLKIKRVEYSNTLTWGQTTYKSTSGWVVLNDCKYQNGTIDGQKLKVKPYLEKTSKNIYITKTYTLPLKSATGKVEYTSEDPSVATVNSAGVVTGIKEGKTYINVTANKTTLRCKIKVKNPVLSATEIELIKGKTAILSVKGGSGNITYTSSKKSVAAVTAYGVVLPKKYGKTVITATRNNIPLECVVKVYDPIISDIELTLKAGDTKELKVSQSSGTIAWKSGDKTIAKVNKNGKVTALTPGTVKIRATVDGVKLYCYLTVE